MKKQEEKIAYYDKQPQLIKEHTTKLRDNIQKGKTGFLIVVTGILLFFILFRFEELSWFFGTIAGVLKPIMYGFIIAFLLNPIVKKVEKYLKPLLGRVIKKESRLQGLNRLIGIIVALVLAIVLVSALLNMVIPELYNSIRNVIVTLPGNIEKAISTIEAMSDKAHTPVEQMLQICLVKVTESLEVWVQNDLVLMSEKILTILTGGVISAVGLVLDLLVGIMTSIYVLFSKEKFLAEAKKIIYAICSAQKANTIIHIGRKANDIFSGFIIGKIIDSAIIGVLCFVGVSILKMPYALLVSVIVGVTNVIPVFGPYIGAIPSIILIMLVDPLKGLYFAIFILLLQQLDGNVIGPTILGDSTGVSPFWIIFSIVVGGGLFGVPGMIVGVPTFALIYYVIKMYIEQKLAQKSLPIETSDYNEMSYVDDNGVYVTLEKQEEKEK